MKPEILALVPIYAPTLAELEREYTVHRLWTAKDPDALMKEVADRVDAVVTTGLAGYGRRHVEALPKLKLIACFGNPHGLAADDRAAAAERGVVVTNTPDSITSVVADLAMGLVVSVMRRIAEGDRFVRAGKWPAGPLAPGRDLGGKTCGIVGLGRIGREIARRAEVFGMAVRWHGPRPKPDVPYPWHADIEELARLSDCLVVICPLTPETRGVVNARVLDALGPEGYLINIARGPVVDQAALIAALKEKRIAGAGLDVFWDEPGVPAELAAMDNVVLTPHIGSTTREIREERGRKLLANLRAHFAGKPLPTPVT
ncbi:MAG TPA: 2-hydroxyacid dehydrogenase [Burkholderiales bacterium]|nr:2-hydroxyacid dehydrogenase [Burkholderiales bacterium]